MKLENLHRTCRVFYLCGRNSFYGRGCCVAGRSVARCPGTARQTESGEKQILPRRATRLQQGRVESPSPGWRVWALWAPTLPVGAVEAPPRLGGTDAEDRRPWARDVCLTGRLEEPTNHPVFRETVTL